MANYDTFKPNQGSTDYLTKIPAHIDATENIATEVENARQGEPSLLANLLNIVRLTGLTGNLNANSNRITGAADAVDNQDYTTLAQVSSLITTGGSPGAVPITSLNVGTLANGQLPINNGGQIVGYTIDRRFDLFLSRR